MSGQTRSSRKRRRPSAVQRLQPFWFLLVVIAAALGVGATYLTSWSALYPHTVVVQGNRVVPRALILDRARIDLSKNMWLQDTASMVARIEAIPYIDNASVHRRPPDSMQIVVTERTPYAFVDAGGSRVTVDHDLRVLQRSQPPALASSLPVLEAQGASLPAPGTFLNGGNLQALRGIADMMLAAHLEPKLLWLDRYNDATVILRNGIRVLLGDEQGMAQKIALIGPIFVQVDRGKRRVVAIDLRALTTPVVVYGR
jgi:cell division protein FtsQ